MIFQKPLLLCAGLGIAILAVTAWAMKPRFWPRVWSAQIQLDDHPQADSTVYRDSQHDEIMIRLPARQDFNDMYIIRLSRKEVATATAAYFWFVSPIGSLAKEVGEAGINMMHDKNNYTDPKPELGENWATFRGMRGERIKVGWPR